MRNIPALLQTHMDGDTTTLCYLLKITPQHVAAFGCTSLDKDVVYDDGGGDMTYSSTVGLNQDAVEASEGLEVDNAEAMILLDVDISKADIMAGVLDYASFQLYRINWQDTAQGHYLVQSGKTGAVRAHDELSGVIELRGIPQQLKQNYIDQYSLSCRAIFGSADGEESFPCNFVETALWQANVVLSVGAEADLTFTCTTAPAATGPNGALTFDVAIVEFLTGNNAGLIVETETVAGSVVTLRFPSAYDVEVGDTFNMRPDCQKRFVEDCVGYYDNGLNFRGEPWIPLTEESPSMYPGANVAGMGGLSGGAGEDPEGPAE